MKTKHLMFFLLAVVMMVGCEKKEAEATLEKVTPAKIEATAAGDTYKVTLESNTSWTATVTSGKESGWITITDGSGNGNGEFSVKVNELTGFGEGRDTSIDIVAGTGDNTKKYVLNVNQAGTAASVSVDPTSKEFDASANSLTVTVTSNGPWAAQVVDAAGKPWCTLENGTGDGNGEFIIKVADNDGEGTREATVKVAMSGEEATVTITQTGRTFSEDTILVSPLTIDNEYDVTLEGSWTASSEDSWIDLTTKSGSGAGKLAFRSSANTDDITASRVGTIKVNSGMETLTITVTQIPMAVVVKHTVNGVEFELYWSTLPVGKYREFMPMPDDRGYFYQFNRTVAYSPFDPCTPEFNTEKVVEVKTDWQPENSPCPDGWKIPDRMEGFAMQSKGAKLAFVEAGERGSRTAGYFVTREGDVEEATLYDMKGCVFFPMTMIRWYSSGELSFPSKTYFVEGTECATFWTSTDWHQNLLPGESAYAVTQGFSNGSGLGAFETSFSKTNGCNIRCIKIVE
jgi:hypothetical protein